jgi:hypothetical protein
VYFVNFHIHLFNPNDPCSLKFLRITVVQDECRDGRYFDIIIDADTPHIAPQEPRQRMYCPRSDHEFHCQRLQVVETPKLRFRQNVKNFYVKPLKITLLVVDRH